LLDKKLPVRVAFLFDFLENIDIRKMPNSFYQGLTPHGFNDCMKTIGIIVSSLWSLKPGKEK
jgi:hypothetical protein